MGIQVDCGVSTHTIRLLTTQVIGIARGRVNTRHAAKSAEVGLAAGRCDVTLRDARTGTKGSPMLRLATLFVALVLAGAPAGTALAACEGRDMLADMTPDARAELEAATDAIPYPRGNFWRATRKTAERTEEITLVGTYHLDDPRHVPLMKTLGPLIAAVTIVLVEAGPLDQKALQDHIARDPSIMLITEGPSLLEQMPAADWRLLTDALAKRGVPSIMAARMRPWYVNLMLAIPTCAPQAATQEMGLDGMVMARATEAGVPVASLERYDTVLGLFDQIPAADQISMIRTTLSMDDRAQDYSTTMANAYFAGESRLLWEMVRQEAYKLPGNTKAMVDAEFARMEVILMDARNQAWIPVMEAAAAKGPVLAAFGALHLPGDEGVLALLERRGFTISPLEF